MTPDLHPPDRGSDATALRLVDALNPGEDRNAVVDLLHHATERTRAGELPLLCHQDLDSAASADERERARAGLRQALVDGRLKHFAVRVVTAAGPRVVKIAEEDSLGSTLLGFFGVSRSGREHRLHREAEARGVAACKSLGFLELKRGVRLVRSCQVQETVPANLVPLAQFLAQEDIRHGDAVFAALGRALAETHAVPFFHSDLKAFHAFVSDVRAEAGSLVSFRLRWIDLDRVAFWMSRRKRVINLYQALRYVVPDRAEAQERFVFAYCERSGWCAQRPERGLAIVRRFLDYKRRTHPYP